MAAVLAVVGKKGDAAKAAYEQNRSILERIRLKPTDVSQLVPEAVEPFWRGVLNKYPGLKKDSTPAAAHTALLALAVNMGTGNPRWNTLTPAITDENWLLLADQIEVSMDDMAAGRFKRFYRSWKKLRVEEANLIRTELGVATGSRHPNFE